MKKTLIITLADGRKIEKDLAKDTTHLPIGTPANDQFYAQLCGFIGANGWVETGTDKYLSIIPASQIAKLEVVFGDDKKVMNVIH